MGQWRDEYTDKIKKLKEKEYSDYRREAITDSNIQEGDMVLIKQEKKNKLTTTFNEESVKVLSEEGAKITVEKNGKAVTRHNTFIKKYLTTVNEEDNDRRGAVEKIPLEGQDRTQTHTISQNGRLLIQKQDIQLPSKFKEYIM